MGEKSDIKVEELDFTFLEEVEKHEPENLGHVEPLKEIVADAGSFSFKVELDKKMKIRLCWMFAKIHFKDAFKYLWRIVVLLFRKG